METKTKIKTSDNKIYFHFNLELLLVILAIFLLIGIIATLIFYQIKINSPNIIIIIFGIFISTYVISKYFFFMQYIEKNNGKIILKKGLSKTKTFNKKESKLKIIKKANDRNIILLSDKYKIEFLNLKLGHKLIATTAGTINLIVSLKNKDNFYAFTTKQVNEIKNFLDVPVEFIKN